MDKGVDKQDSHINIPYANYKLYIYGLLQDTRRTEVFQHFRQYEPTRIQQQTDSANIDQKVFIIAFATKENVIKAMHEKDGVIINKKLMEITDQPFSKRINISQSFSSQYSQNFQFVDLLEIAEPRIPTNNKFQSQEFPQKLIPLYPKEQIENLPLFTYKGKINIINTISLAQQAVQQLFKEEYVGFGTELQIVQEKDNPNVLILVQIASQSEVWLFFIQQIGGIQLLIPLFISDSPQKICITARGCINRLCFSQIFEPRGFVQLTDVTRSIGIIDTGLQRLCANLLQIHVQKTSQDFNWGNYPLSENLTSYAATDCWVTKLVYEAAWEYKIRGLALPQTNQQQSPIDKHHPDIYIQNISENITIEKLQEILQEQAIQVQKVKLKKKGSSIQQDHQDFKVRTGLIWLEEGQDLQMTITKLNGFVIDGVKVNVKGRSWKNKKESEDDIKDEENEDDVEFRGIKMEDWSEEDNSEN
ncbi:MAG: putative 3'-5' exonuclease [Streblomastix strix]|uniref:Putative 3'-5' exonuclease n=1 Tax=Streblomastix strix TaxID=222440 RepID=A0A5J4WDA5_9EUKA|nr:MAG: putative 3'-5' exonuclease [Streblomastix strix]